MNKLLDKILSEVALDQRVSNGMFNIEENDHMEALRDYLAHKGIDEESVKAFSNKVLEGKYPERQAYNAKGILVTFPTPEYKANAIKAGTHFEEDPMRKMSNIFTAPDPITAPAPEKEKSKDEPKTNLPVSQATPPETSADTPQEEPQPKTTAAPQQTPTPDQESDAEAEVEPNAEPAPPPVKSPEEKEADKNAIKTMLKGDDYMLERVVEYLLNPVSNHYRILEEIKKRL
jgi:hypothetical protein